MAPRKPFRKPAAAASGAGLAAPGVDRQITWRDPRDLKPSPHNARRHPPEQIRQLRQSFRERGVTGTWLVDEDDTILVGHGRNQAAIEEGLAEVPTLVARGWSEAQKRACILADNKLALNAEWDDETLKSELAFLEEADVDLGLTGFSAAELAKLLAVEGAGLAEDDEVPEPGARPVAVRGDVWLVGRHRLVCGDATSADDVAKALAGASPHLMVTDPPYGVAYDPEWRDDKAPREKGPRAAGPVENDGEADWREASALFPGDVAYVWHAALFASAVEAGLIQNGFETRYQIVWDKGRFVLGRGNYHWGHEAAWYVVRKGKPSRFAGDRKQSTVWDVAMPAKSETGHATQKPLELMRRCVLNNSAPGQAVYDPFLGSGTTLIACERTGRTCHALEIAEAHVDRAILRWQGDTGLSATLEADGRTFVEVMAARAPATAVGLADHAEA